MPRWTLLVALPLLCSAAQAGERRALIVGANNGGEGLESLRYAHDDARRMGEVLRELGGFDATSLTYLEDPTTSELSEVLGQLQREAEADPDGLFLFYYSGHADNTGLLLGSEVYSWEALKSGIRSVPADMHLGMLDACRSGEITRMKGAKVEAPFLVGDALSAEGEAWIAASAQDEDAQESDTLQGSFFTHYLVSGLRGAADGGDGWVSLNEAYTYAYERTVARTSGTEGGTQHPSYDFKIQGNGDLKLTELTAATASVVFPAHISGEVQISRALDGTPVVEVAKRDDRSVTVALPPGAYQIRVRSEEGLSEQTIGLDAGETRVLDSSGDAVAMEDTAAKGGAPERLVETDGEYIRIRKPSSLDLDSMDSARVEEVLLGLRTATRPGLDAGMSALVPGLGQIMQGRTRAGLGFMGGFVLLNGGMLGTSAVLRDSDSASIGPAHLGLVAGGAIYGWAISDAYEHGKQEGYKPRTGTTISLDSAWVNDWNQPWSSGLTIEALVTPSIGIGIDRLGWVGFRDPIYGSDASVIDAGDLIGGEARAGARVSLGPTLRSGRIRPAVFIAAGTALRHSSLPDEPDLAVRFIPAAGVTGRFYLKPRFFVQAEFRGELDRDAVVMSGGAGMGVHLAGG